ncbi:MAG TPA: hypothetical protein VLN08_09430, partial [Vicinamibacterales bacterium]|nr:hypothetical protein [Vicinamibacterales bacterium]
GYPMIIAGSAQTPALGAAASAAVTAGAAAGGYATVAEAQAAMVRDGDTQFVPDAGARRLYDELYGIYLELHDTFGGVPGSTVELGTAMKRLLAIRDRVSAI